MISYFRLNDPYRLISIFIILLLIRLPFFISGGTLTLPEFNRMLLGERMAQGDMLYVEVWESTAPLSALVFSVLTYLFGRSQMAFQLLALLVVAHQCFLFNKTMLTIKAYKENTYVPGLVYALLMSLFFDFFTLSPLLLATTFLLLCLNKLFLNIEFRDKKDDGILNIGLYLGIATLFYLPVFVYTLAVLLVLLIFMRVSLRYYLLMIYGFLIPLAFLGCYYFYHGALGNLYFNYFFPVFSFHKELLMPLGAIALVFVVPFVFLVLATAKINGKVRFTNFQSRLVRAMSVWLFFSLLSLLFVTELSPTSLMLLVPGTAFFIAHYFLLLRKVWVRELSFAAFLVLLIVMNTGTFYGFSITKDWVRFERLLVRESPWSTASKGKRVLVLGESLAAYQEAMPVTPYLDWYLASRVFTRLGYYDNLTHIYTHLMSARPELIIDELDIMPSLLDKMPLLAKQYKKDGQTYRLINEAR